MPPRPPPEELPPCWPPDELPCCFPPPSRPLASCPTRLPAPPPPPECPPEEPPCCFPLPKKLPASWPTRFPEPPPPWPPLPLCLFPISAFIAKPCMPFVSLHARLMPKYVECLIHPVRLPCLQSGRRPCLLFHRPRRLDLMCRVRCMDSLIAPGCCGWRSRLRGLRWWAVPIARRRC
jgi:hypothetical protein